MGRFAMAAAAVENTLYFSDRYRNGLYQLNLQDGECSFIDYFYEEEDKQWLYSQAFLWEEKIYFIPGLADRIACFDTVSGGMAYIDLPGDGIVIHGVDGISAEKFRCQRQENILWMMPVGYNLFLKLDMSDGTLSKIDLPDCLEFREGTFNWRSSSLYGTEMRFQSWAWDVRVFYDIVTGAFQLEKFERGIRRYLKSFRKDTYEIYVPWELQYGLLTKNVVSGEEKAFFFDGRMDGCTCAVMYLIADVLYLLPQTGHNMIMVSAKDFSMEYLDLNEAFGKNIASWDWTDLSEGVGKYYISSVTMPEILEIDRNDASMRLLLIKEKCNSRKKKIDRCMANPGKKMFQAVRKEIMHEGMDGVEQLIAQTNHCCKKRQDAKCDVGDRIYKNARKLLLQEG